MEIAARYLSFATDHCGSTPGIDHIGPPICGAPKPGELRLEEHIQIGVITQFLQMLVKTHGNLPHIDTGLGLPTG
jgi:hypothetical protein